MFYDAPSASAQNVKRLVIVKVDGLSKNFLDKYISAKDKKTGRSYLPWFEEIFYRNGTRLENFYSRGLSLSTPSWVVLDTGQHLQIKGNIEYDRMTERSYDYLGFISYYVNYGLKNQVDMPATEVLDTIKTPLLIDAFPYEKRYQSYQLLQRGTDWGVMANGFLNMFPRQPLLLVDEWTLGFDFLNLTVDQNVRDIVRRIETRPDIDYFDLYSAEFDHVSHLNNSDEARFQSLKKLDYTLGMIWTAIQRSSRANETALIIVSDHGLNSVSTSYSQGFNLVELLQSSEGGGHHVVTKLRPRLEYSVKGLNPYDSPYVNAAKNSPYLKGQADKYPTAKFDLDGNERASLWLRDNRLNILQILLQQLQNAKLSPAVRKAAENEFFRQIELRRAVWQNSFNNWNAELDAMRAQIAQNQEKIARLPKKFSNEEFIKGIDKDARRLQAQTAADIADEKQRREYLRVLANLLELKPQNFNAKKIKAADFIPENSLGEINSIYHSTNYVIRLGKFGLQINTDGTLNLEKSFDRINYFDFFTSQKVRNNVQKDVGSAPIDFVAATIPIEQIKANLSDELKSDEDSIWIYASPEKQVLILTRRDENGQNFYKYLPIRNLSQKENGEIHYEPDELSEGLPFHYFEDENLNVPREWLSEWHSEQEWLEATHLTKYSAAIINIYEQLAEHKLEAFRSSKKSAELTSEPNLLDRFRLHQRKSVKSDLLILANDRWHFDVKGFNSGGNHGSFFRISSNSVLMFAGGRQTRIPKGLSIKKPYDGLSFVPTIFSLLGEIDRQNKPLPKLQQKGFRQFPAPVVSELFSEQNKDE